MPLLLRFFQLWGTLSPTRRSVVVAIPLCLICTIIGFCYFALPHEVALFAAPLESEQLSQVDAQLAAWNIFHVTTADNIDIDAAQRNTVLLRLSLMGLPHAHIANSDETLAKASALTPDALLEAQSRTGLAGDIAIALRSIDGIAEASVVIAPARTATFTDENSSVASASVRLELRPGVVLSTSAIDGIRAFVSRAVPGLDREHVVLLDDHGVALDGSSDTTHDDAETTRLSLQSAFDTAFGEGTTIVRVHAMYAHRTEHAHDIERLPVAGAAVALQSSDERYKSGEKQYSKHDTSEDRGSIVRDRESNVNAGSLSHLSVAVFVDQTRNINLQKVRSLALATTGIDDAETQYIHVESVSFSRPHAIRAVDSLPWLSLASIFLPYIAVTAAFSLLFVRARTPLTVLSRKLLDRERIRGATVAAVGIAPREVLGILAGEPPHTAAAVISALPTVTATAVLDLYSPEERGAIVARMTQPVSGFAPTWDQVRRAT